MSKHFTEEHQAFRKTVKTFVDKELVPNVDKWEEDGLVPNYIFKKAGDLGLHGAHFKEEHGGLGGDYWFSVAKAEEYAGCNAAGVGLGLLVQSDMATPCIADLGNKEQIEEFLKPALAGDKIAALGVTEPDAGSDVAGIRTVAKRDGDDYVINGAKTYITNGTRASFVTMLVKTNPEAGYNGISIVLVPTDTKGFHVSKKLKKLGNHASDTAELHLEDCRVPARYLLGEENRGFFYLMQNFQTERLIGSCTTVEGCKRLLDDAVQYGRDRKAFGKPIIKREVWQHRFVDLYTELEACKQLSYHACDRYNEERYVKGTQLSFETVKLISMAKLKAGELSTEIADTCLQFHGGMGYMDETPISRAWRDMRLIRIGGGTSEVMRYAIAKIMGL